MHHTYPLDHIMDTLGCLYPILYQRFAHSSLCYVVWLQADPSLGEDPKKKAAMRRKKNLPTTLTPGRSLLLPYMSFVGDAFVGYEVFLTKHGAARVLVQNVA